VRKGARLAQKYWRFPTIFALKTRYAQARALQLPKKNSLDFHRPAALLRDRSARGDHPAAGA